MKVGRPISLDSYGTIAVVQMENCMCANYLAFLSTFVYGHIVNLINALSLLDCVSSGFRIPGVFVLFIYVHIFIQLYVHTILS